MYSTLANQGLTKEEIADTLRLRCNELGKMYFDEQGNLIDKPTNDVVEE